MQKDIIYEQREKVEIQSHKHKPEVLCTHKSQQGKKERRNTTKFRREKNPFGVSSLSY